MLRGMSVPDGLLTLLRDGPKHGYQLASDFAERTAGVWSLNTGQVYTTLDRLSRDGFVAAEEGDDADSRRRPWRLTPAGRERAERWLASAPAPTTDRDDLVLRVMLAAAVDPTAALAVVDGQRHQLVARLQEIRRRQRAASGELLARLAADAAAVRVESDLRWLDLAEQRLLMPVLTDPSHPTPITSPEDPDDDA